MEQQELDRIAAEVRRSLAASVPPSARAPAQKTEEPIPPPVRLVTENVVYEAHKSGQSTILIAPKAIITPLAKDALNETGIIVASALSHADRLPTRLTDTKHPQRKDVAQVAFGAVTSGHALEVALITELRRSNFIPLRVPTPRREAAHLARQVAGAVSSGHAAWGVIIDETGVVGAAVANHVTNVVAAMCHDEMTAQVARKRLGANVLCVASDVVAVEFFKRILSTWISTPPQPDEDIASVLRELDRCQDAAR